MTPEETGLDFDAIKTELETEEWVKDDFNEDVETRQVFLGTVMALYPSGKFYMPWSSNVTEKEAEKDEKWREAVEEGLEKIGAYLISGDGDPCDLFVEQNRTIDEDE